MVSWLWHTSGCFHCMLYCFALGSNVSTLMTVQWCKWGTMVKHVMCNVCGCLSTDEAPIWQSVSRYPSSLCKMIVICFRLVAISFYYKFPECNAPFLPIEVMFACCIIFVRCTTNLFKLAHDALKIMESAITVWRHIICITLLHLHFTSSCVQLHLRISNFVGTGFHTWKMFLVVVFICW
jgi:hypothetical protein